MSDPVSGRDFVPENGAGNTVKYYKKDFWSKENLQFGRPWYRLEKSSRIISKIARGQERTLFDVGCGPAALARLLPANIQYYGVDIAIQEPAPNLVEADFLKTPISFGDKRFDIIVAGGVFEYVGEFQEQKFSEIAQILNRGGTFMATYTNFGHRSKQVYWPFSNVQPLDDFRRSLARYFKIERSFPASHNWKHAQPNRRLVRAGNMHLNMNIPYVSPLLAVEYYFICSPLA